MFVELRNLNIPPLEFKSSYVWRITGLCGYSINSTSVPYIKDRTHRMRHICKELKCFAGAKLRVETECGATKAKMLFCTGDHQNMAL